MALHGAPSRKWGLKLPAMQSLAPEGQAGKGGSVMKQPQQAQAQATQIPIREMGVAEVVALALSVYRKRVREGKTSLRVTVRLKPSHIPPPSGNYQTSLGEIQLKSFFKADEGRWFVQVRLPNSEGFKVSELVKNQPSPSQATQL